MALLPWVLSGKGCPCRGALLLLRCSSAHLGFKCKADGRKDWERPTSSFRNGAGMERGTQKAHSHA